MALSVERCCCWDGAFNGDILPGTVFIAMTSSRAFSLKESVLDNTFSTMETICEEEGGRRGERIVCVRRGMMVGKVAYYEVTYWVLRID